MDPVGPWSAYASYNRLGDAHLPSTAAAPPTTSSQLLPGSFLSPTPVAYETVFSPLLYGAGKGPTAHYVAAAAQHRLKQDTTEYAQPQPPPPFFDHGTAAWQQNSPFGILPHESVVPTSSAAKSTTATYENFNHFTAAQSLNHLNSQLAKTTARAESPAVTKGTPNFFQADTKPFSPPGGMNVQSCIVSSPNVATVATAKEYRVPQAPRAYLTSPPQRSIKQVTQQVQTKNQHQSERRPNEDAHPTQSSPVSFPLNYTPSKRSTPQQFQAANYRHYQPTSTQQASTNEEFQRPKSGSDYNSTGPDCNVVVPRRPSPLQAHSQASPLGHAPSPAYPMYNSPMNSISSPQQSSANHVTPPSPLDVSVPRPSPQTNVAYPSVITRANNNCWEDRQQNRKFQVPVNSGYGTAQQYFENGGGTNQQVSLQDLSSCRGDPMSLVKNLQQQSCQQVGQEIKDVKMKKCKTDDKGEGRVPPPAHSSAAQGQQQQNNGAYFDFDRWNLPPSTTKIFPGQPMHQQHQSLMVPHPPPPLPYFTPFHLPPHPAEYPTTVELAPIANYDQQSVTQHQTTQFQQEDQPKVVVPNIEEELNFLSRNTNNVVKPPAKDKQTSGTGFMSSYLKFLQGERENSPPPVSKTNRKTNWARQQKQEERILESNGATLAPPLPQPAKRLSSDGDPQDDPRYFPLPKERKRNSFDSDSDGLSSEDDFFNKQKFPIERKERRKRPNKTSSERKRPKKQPKVKEEDVILPRRESSKRAAKEKMNFQSLVKDDDLEEPPEFQDSDSDPAWTPQAKEEADDILPVSKKLGGRKGGPGRKRKNLITAAAQGAGIDMFEGDSRKKGRSKQSAPPTLEDNIAAALNNHSCNDDNPFKTGEFVVIRSELCQDWPAIWKVDGKTLLQKYEPFEQNGVTLYKNISTYTSWTPESRKQYISVPVRLKSQNQSEIIVEFLRSEMNYIDTDYQEKCMKDCEGYQDNFEVYIQTLISQALDSNFLTEIFQEKDEYFLSNVKIIDDITDSKKRKFLLLLRWPPAVQAAVCTWPCFNVIRFESNGVDANFLKICGACGRAEAAVRVLMYGQPYNSTTLEGCQPDPKAMNEKNFLMCRLCANRVELSNKVTHQKYLMYIECAKRVAEKRTGDPSKDTTCILNELLADESWLNQLFLEVRTTWAEIDCIEYSFKVKNNSVYTQ